MLLCVKSVLEYLLTERLSRQMTLFNCVAGLEEVFGTAACRKSEILTDSLEVGCMSRGGIVPISFPQIVALS